MRFSNAYVELLQIWRTCSKMFTTRTGRTWQSIQIYYKPTCQPLVSPNGSSTSHPVVPSYHPRISEVFTRYTDSAFPSDSPVDQSLRFSLRYEVGAFYRHVRELEEAIAEKNLSSPRAQTW